MVELLRNPIDERLARKSLYRNHLLRIRERALKEHSGAKKIILDFCQDPDFNKERYGYFVQMAQIEKEGSLFPLTYLLLSFPELPSLKNEELKAKVVLRSALRAELFTQPTFQYLNEVDAVLGEKNLQILFSPALNTPEIKNQRAFHESMIFFSSESQKFQLYLKPPEHKNGNGHKKFGD